MNKKVVIIGGEGNGGVIAACIEDNRNRYSDFEWELVGFINDYETEVCGYPVVGKLSDIPSLLQTTDYYFSWAIHLVGRNVKTVELFLSATEYHIFFYEKNFVFVCCRCFGSNNDGFLRGETRGADSPCG